MFDCVGIGICAVDYLCLLSHYPALDEKMDAEQFSYQGGGPVPNALITLARLGAKTAYIGVVGDDEHGKFTLEEFEQEWVDISGVVVDKNCQTNQAFIWIDQQTGKKTVVLNKNSTAELMPNELSNRHITSTRYLHLDGRETEATIAAIELAKEAGVEIVLDAGSPRKRIEEILSLVDYPIVSESFCRNYLKTSNYEEGLEKLVLKGASIAVVTCGAKGCYAADSTGVVFQPAFNVNVVDTTGAGDVYHGAFIYGLLQNWELPQIMKFAAATAAIKCMHLGGRNGIPDLNKVNQFLLSKEENQ
ncbi:hypothetical protein JW960_25575 [candidate division KSB1 bacterium]|nr:hypothetical protein [candidate division KSB1 bacterium]